VGESRNSPNFWSTPIISGIGKATNFKFGRYIHSQYGYSSYTGCMGTVGTPVILVYGYSWYTGCIVRQQTQLTVIQE